jgi:transcription antitermination factor NusG
MPSWIAVYTKSRHEKAVYSLFSDKGIETYLPLIRRKKKWSDRTKWIDVPLFRSYVFAYIDLKDYLDVLQTDGVLHIVKFQNHIATIPESQIVGLRQMIDGGYDPVPIEYLVLGDKVRIRGGPLTGIEGIVSRIDGVDRFIIKIDAIQHAVSVQIDRKFLKPISWIN